ncbi:MAG TPA: hypothetical protein VNM14_05515 [Planctomycetota bacterium]|jgi:hypothetical protein|nr:hypothetical protein [Planctomycetota bacterium]
MSIFIALLLALQQPVETDPAVKKGLAFLKSKAEDLGESRDVVLWTLVSAQVRETDPLVQRLLRDLLPAPLEATRSVALQAMILQELDASKYRYRIAQCAQFLVDNQGADGQWDAGRAVPMPELRFAEPKFGRGGPRAFGGPAGLPDYPKLLLKKLQAGPEKGNASDSRWAIWGLLAAHRARIVPPAEVAAKAEVAWRSASADPAEVLSCLSIALYLQEKDHKKDPDVLKAIDRLVEAKRPSDPVSLSVQKVAMIHAGTDKLGPDWWSNGIKTVLPAQQADGSWGSIDATCAAIRFIYYWRVQCIDLR